MQIGVGCPGLQYSRENNAGIITKTELQPGESQVHPGFDKIGIPLDTLAEKLNSILGTSRSEIGRAQVMDDIDVSHGLDLPFQTFYEQPQIWWTTGQGSAIQCLQGGLEARGDRWCRGIVESGLSTAYRIFLRHPSALFSQLFS